MYQIIHFNRVLHYKPSILVSEILSFWPDICTKSSILIGFCIINHPFWLVKYHHFGQIYMYQIIHFNRVLHYKPSILVSEILSFWPDICTKSSILIGFCIINHPFWFVQYDHFGQICWWFNGWWRDLGFISSLDPLDVVLVSWLTGECFERRWDVWFVYEREVEGSNRICVFVWWDELQVANCFLDLHFLEIFLIFFLGTSDGPNMMDHIQREVETSSWLFLWG